MESSHMVIKVLTNANIISMDEKTGYGQVSNGVIVLNNTIIEWIGSGTKLPEKYNCHKEEDLEGRLVTPGLIDCHTHIIFGGDRSKEFEMRLSGATYEMVAKAGGGIVSTVLATKNLSQEELTQQALPRIDHLINEGVTTIEIKSGYGLDNKTELKMLRAARHLASLRNINIRTSFLGAHAIPLDFIETPDVYINEICIPTLREAHSENLIDAVDGFCENIAFNTSQIRRVFEEAHNLGLPVKLHAEQLSQSGGTQLAAEFSALSADHLEYSNKEDVMAIARSGTVAVLLPGAFYTLKEKQKPPVEDFRKLGVPIAIATDCNPGSSPMSSILTTMNMACTLFSMTPEETLRGVTSNAARALGLKGIGKISPGYKADLAIWNVKEPAELSYRIGFNPLYKRVIGGVL